ncbi:hypothetical protein EV401DRAFT_1889518 [Pisolithus croceorrhizus]|nr:hypothetical protein EV401DRAFT_1889518 [Pisolithus croceorrhizus]
MASSHLKATYSTLPLFLPALKVSRLVPGSFPPYCCVIVGWYHSYVDPEELCAMGPVHWPPAFCTACCTPILPVDSFLESLTIVLHSQWEPVSMPQLTSPADPPVKIGPPIGARRSKRIQATVLSSTKTQPSHGTKACCPVNQPAVATRSCDTAPENDESSLVAQSSTLKPCPWHSSQGLTAKEHKEQYLNSFHTKMVVLKDSTKLDQHTALEQLSGPLDMSLDAHPPDEDDHHESSLNLPSENVSNDQSMQSEEDEWAIENVMQSEHADVLDLGAVNHANDAEDEHADIKDMVKHRKPKRKSDHILTKASEAPDLDQEDEPGMESNLYAHRHGRLPLAAIKKAQQLGKCTTQEAQAIADEYGKTLESIMAAAGLMTRLHGQNQFGTCTKLGVLLGPDFVLENLKDYYYRQMKHYESHKDEEEFPDLWVEIWKFWSESISGTKDMSLKAMVGQLMTCRDSFMQAAQTWCNVGNIHVFGCVIYTRNNEAACQAQGIFAGSSLCMQLAGERQTDIARLLDYLTTIIKYDMITVGRSYDHVLALKPQESTRDRSRWAMDYHMETRLDGDDEHGDYIVPEPALSFSLKPWTADQLALVHMMNPKAFEIPLVTDTFGQPLCLLSDSQVFLKGVPRVTKASQGVSGGFAVWWSMSITALLVRDITIIPLMKMTIPAHAISTTELEYWWYCNP